MTQADSVHSTPPTNMPVDTTRRRFLAVAAFASVAGAGSLAAVAMTPNDVPHAVTMPNGSADPAFALIAEKRAADIAHGNAIDAQDEADGRYGNDSEQAWDAAEACEEACVRAMDVAWQLARTAPTTLAGVIAILRFANQHEDEGFEWANTDTIGREGWHYQLRATMAQAIETIIRRRVA